MNEDNLKKLKVASGIHFKNEALVDHVSCLEGKLARLPFPTSDSKAKDLLELVHSDLCGLVEVPSFGGNRYFITFVDDASKKRNGRTRLLKRSRNSRLGKKLKVLRTYNGTEYINKSFRQVLEREGVRHRTTCPYTPE